MLPARVEAEGPARLLITPDQPLGSAHTYGLSLRLFNPSLSGFHPLRLWVAADPAQPLAYLGTWLIQILEESE